MSESYRKIMPIVLEALTARGWSEAESEQMVNRLIKDGVDAAMDYSNLVIPFGKHKGDTLGEVLQSNKQYLHWLWKQDWLEEEWPLLKLAIKDVLLWEDA